MKFNQDRVITVAIDTGKEKYKQTVSSRSTVKELTHSIKKNHLSIDKDCLINLYYKGHLLSKEEEFLENITNSDELELVMVVINLTDSIRNDKEKLQDALIQKLSKDCPLHGEKLMYICLTCGTAFCEKCQASHKDHKTVNKTDVVQFQNELNDNKENMIKAFESLGINENQKITDDSICKNLRDEMDTAVSKLNEFLTAVNRKKGQIYTEFKNDFNKIFPFLLEYKERVENLYDITKKETLIRNEREFIDFYFKYKNIQDSSNKINDKIVDLKNKIELFKDNLAELLNKTKSTYDYIKRDLLSSQLENSGPKFTNNIINLNSINNLNSNFNDLTSESRVLKQTVDLPGRSNSRVSTTKVNGFAKLNLRNLLSPPKDRRNLIKCVEQQIRERKNTSPTSSSIPQCVHKKKSVIYNSSHNKIEELNCEESIITEFNPNEPILQYYNIEVGSNNLISYQIKDKKVNKIPIDLSGTIIRRFEAYHSTLNHTGRFYISGGYSTSKMFYKYNAKEKSFTRLSDMPTGHSYHCLLGVGGFVFALGGFKSKKVEKYIHAKNAWESLPDTNVSRSWPGCISVDDTYLLLFGGLCDKTETTDKIIEKFNIKEPNGKWETIEFSYNEPIPFYFGVVNINNEQVLLFGGKTNAKEDNTNNCYKFNCSNNVLEIDNELKLPNKDEFDGKTFFELEKDTYGMFSAIHSDIFYVFNSKEKSFELIKYEEGGEENTKKEEEKKRELK